MTTQTWRRAVLAVVAGVALAAAVVALRQRSAGELDLSWVKRRVNGVAYAHASPAQTLDILYPDSGEPPYPVVIAIHGGWFAAGWRTDGQLAPMAQALHHGYAVATIDYRLVDEARYPAQVDDAVAALRFIHANASRYDLDPSRIVVWGNSAGAYLGAYAALTHPELVRAVIDFYGITDFRTLDAEIRRAHRSEPDPLNSSARISAYLGPAWRTDPALRSAASLPPRVTGKAPPFFIAHSSRDTVVPIDQSRELVAALRERGAVVHFEEVDSAIHGGSQYHTEPMLGRIFSFLSRVMDEHAPSR